MIVWLVIFAAAVALAFAAFYVLLRPNRNNLVGEQEGVIDRRRAG